MRESPTKILASSADPAATAEATVTLGATGDGRMYHIKAIHMPTATTTAATGVGFTITDSTGAVIWQAQSLTDVGTGALSAQAHRGIAAGFTDGSGGEVMVLPDKMVVPGGYIVNSLTELTTNIDHGIMKVFGSVFKSL